MQPPGVRWPRSSRGSELRAVSRSRNAHSGTARDSSAERSCGLCRTRWPRRSSRRGSSCHASLGSRSKIASQPAAEQSRPGCKHRIRQRRSVRPTRPTRDGKSRLVQAVANRSSPSRIQIRIRTHRPSRRTKHRQAPKSDGRTDTRKPAQATNPTLRQHTSSAHSDTGPSPRNRTKPRSIPNKAHTPIGRRDTEPSQPAAAGRHTGP